MPASAAPFTLLAMHLSLRHRRALATMVVVSAVAGGLAVPSATATHPTPVPTLDWADCGDGFECATAELPLDYGKPRRDTIDISLIRHPAVDQANRIGTLFLAHPLGMVDCSNRSARTPRAPVPSTLRRWWLPPTSTAAAAWRLTVTCCPT